MVFDPLPILRGLVGSPKETLGVNDFFVEKNGDGFELVLFTGFRYMVLTSERYFQNEPNQFHHRINSSPS